MLNVIVDPDPAIGIIGVAAVEPGSRQLREFERMPGESVEDLKERAYVAMGWA